MSDDDFDARRDRLLAEAWAERDAAIEHRDSLLALLEGKSQYVDCACPGCPRKVPEAWASGMCEPCAIEDCEHTDGAKAVAAERDALKEEVEATRLAGREMATRAGTRAIAAESQAEGLRAALAQAREALEDIAAMGPEEAETQGPWTARQALGAPLPGETGRLLATSDRLSDALAQAREATAAAALELTAAKGELERLRAVLEETPENRAVVYEAWENGTSQDMGGAAGGVLARERDRLRAVLEETPDAFMDELNSNMQLHAVTQEVRNGAASEKRLFRAVCEATLAALRAKAGLP